MGPYGPAWGVMNNWALGLPVEVQVSSSKRDPDRKTCDWVDGGIVDKQDFCVDVADHCQRVY